jgi:hypothetical protein
MRARIFFEPEKVPAHMLSDVSIELAKVPLSGRTDFDAIGQDSVSEFSHEVTKRNTALLLRLFQGGASVFEIQAVHFFLREALQETEVVHGNDGGQVLPAAGDYRSLFSICGTVYDFGKLFPSFRDIEACHKCDVLFVQFVRIHNQYPARVAFDARELPSMT